MKKLQLNFKDKTVEVVAEKIRGRVWVHYQGETYSYEPKNLLDTASQIELGDPSQVQAPMPGKVIKILKKEGDSVATGETIIVLEAMKMEYNLKAIANARVDKLHCQEGDNVTLGIKLASLSQGDDDA